MTLILFILSLFLSFSPVMAQESIAPVNKDDVSKLIDTLKSDTDREKLITDLQLLLEQQKKDKTDEIIPTLTEELGFRGEVSNLVKKYENFLDQNAISSSTVHQSAGTIIVIAAMVGLFAVAHSLSLRLIRSFEKFSSRLGVKMVRAVFYTHVLQNIFRVFIVGLAIYTLGKIWEIKLIEGFFESPEIKSTLSASVTVLFVAMISVFIWEAIGVYLAYIMIEAHNNNRTRVKTLLPIIRNIVMSIFALLFGLVMMSELGINVAPLIAGAGVVGVAVGFGAQNMVKDFLTGFTIVLEDIIRVGDVISIGGCNGSVEAITLRKVQLRDFDGCVYTVPFSQITTIKNMTKDYSFYVMDISVAYNTDTDRVVEVLKSVDNEMREDELFSKSILAPIEIVGVDKFADSAVIIKARIKTRPIKQWEVGREFNRRMKIAFDKNGIEIPFPQRVVTVRGNEGLVDKATLGEVID